MELNLNYTQSLLVVTEFDAQRGKQRRMTKMGNMRIVSYLFHPLARSAFSSRFGASAEQIAHRDSAFPGQMKGSVGRGVSWKRSLRRGEILQAVVLLVR
jgi:hypothetical protein